MEWLKTQSFPAVSPVTIMTSQPCCSQSELHFRDVLPLLPTLVKLCFSVGSFLFAIASSHHHSVLLRVTSGSHRPGFPLSYILAQLSW